MVANLVQLRRDDLLPGVPLPFAVYDQESRLVCGEGQVIDTASAVDELVLRGVYRAAANEGGHASEVRNGLPANTQECGFEDIRLHVGDALQLQSQAGKERHYVKLVGYVPGGSLMVTTPTVDGRVLLMREGQGFVARVFSGRAAFAFNTVVRKVCNTPFPYLHLQFPKVVQGVSVRREARIRLRVIASVTRMRAPGPPVPAVIGDLSPSGARIEAREPLAGKGEVLQVSFRLKLDSDDAYFVSEAIVRSAREEHRGSDGGERSIMHGVEFVGMQPNERLLLRTLILQRLAEGGHDGAEAR
jgi:hypothetical protein